MAEYIEKNAAIARLTRLEVTDANATMVDAKRVLADMPCAEAVSLHDIYRVIAGHSYYHGDRILSALTCMVEGKEVNPVCPTDMAPVVHTHWQPYEDTVQCSACGFGTFMDGYFFVHGECTHADDRSFRFSFCPNCGAKMDKELLTVQDVEGSAK